MLFIFDLNVDENVIEVYYHKNVELFYRELVDITLECGRCIDLSKRYHLVLKIVIADFEGPLLFVFFPNLYLMVGIG